MQSQCLTWQGTVGGLAALAVLATCGLISFADPPPAKNDPPQPLSEETVQAWKKAGAHVGWVSVNPDGGYFPEFYSEKRGRAGEVPAFGFSVWTAGVLPKLPVPGAAFGLSLGRAKVTDAGLKELTGLKSLQSLNLVGAKVTDAGLKELAGLKSLQSLDLGGTKVTDAGLKELAGIKSLQSLNLYNTRVTDAGLKELAGLKSLQSLDLDSTRVTDAGLKELAGLKSLQALSLSGTQVTDAGVAELRKALPGCQIRR